MSLQNHAIGVVGAGTMGNGIAQAFAAAGYPVTMRDLKPEFLDRGVATITKSLDRLVSRQKLTKEQRDEALKRIKPTTELKNLASCDVVVEAILEDYELKAGLIHELDAICAEETVFATNTSSISVTQIAAASRIPGRVVGMHFFNPVPMMQLVEVIRALQTTDAVCAAVVNLVESVGKKARVSKDSYGFVVNRVLIPMINEAINCVHEGLASPEDIDVMMKLGANHPTGPLSLADLIGLDVVLDIMETLYQGFDDPKFRPSPLLKANVSCRLSGSEEGARLLHLSGGLVDGPAAESARTYRGRDR
jgi:3-hydroxybutyryl-CoA dehydrogenase